jgi:glucose-1-phosphate thymidylyltransferase
MFLGDNLVKEGISEFAAQFRARDGGTAAEILLAKVPDPHRFGVAELAEDGTVRALVEKPAVPASDLALVGVYFFDSTIHRAVAAIKPSGRGELEITDAVQWLIDNGHRVSSRQITGYWKDLGQPEALLDGNRLVLEDIDVRLDGEIDLDSAIEGRVVVERGSTIIRSKVRGPAVIGAGTVIEDSYVGPFTSIGPGCTLKSCEIENSIVLEGSRVVDAGRLEGSILGKRAMVSRRELRPRANRLVIGDHSIVELS